MGVGVLKKNTVKLGKVIISMSQKKKKSKITCTHNSKFYHLGQSLEILAGAGLKGMEAIAIAMGEGKRGNETDPNKITKRL